MKRRRQQSGKLTLLRFLLLLILSRQALSQTTSDGFDQAQALLDFKRANGNNSRALESWVNGTDFCTNWNGVTCYSNFSVPYVQAVRLTDAGLVGELSTSLGKLTSLRWLELSGNSITGPIPAQLSALRGLKQLRLDNNVLGGSKGGSIPLWLRKMSTLQDVSMASNQIQGEIPSGVFTNMSSLRTLVFSNNTLTGPIPSDLDVRFNSSLQIVLLSENILMGSIPNSIASSQSLRIVNISKNSFAGELPKVWNAPSLASLDCSLNNLGGTIPESLFALPNLRYLNLANNSFIGKVTQDVSCRFGESAFTGNVQLIVEPCTRGSSPTTPPVPAPNSGVPLLITSPSLSPSPLPSSVHGRGIAPLLIIILSSLAVAAAVTVAFVVYCVLRRRRKAQLDMKTEAEKVLTLRDQFKLARAPGRDRIQAADARGDGNLSGFYITKDKSSGTYISCSMQSESFGTTNTFNPAFIESTTRSPIAHTEDKSSGTHSSSSRQSESLEMNETSKSDLVKSPVSHFLEHIANSQGGRRGLTNRPSASSTEFSDEYTARSYTATMYTDLLDKVLTLREDSLQRDYSLRSKHSPIKSTLRHGDLEQATT